MSDQDRMINQRPSDRQDNEQRGLARRQERGLSQYEGYVSPFEMMRRFSEDVDRLFGGFGFSSFPFDAGRSLARTGASGGTGFTSWSPSVDVFTRDNDLVVAAEVPGMKPEDVNVEIEGNNLIIQGQTRAEKENREQIPRTSGTPSAATAPSTARSRCPRELIPTTRRQTSTTGCLKSPSPMR